MIDVKEVLRRWAAGQQKGKHYKRPPETEQHFVPEKY